MTNEEAIRKVRGYLTDLLSIEDNDEVEEIMLALEQQPSERLKGKWITWKEAGNYIPSETRFECSVCHDAAQTLCNGLDLLSPYCPNCGAEMEV